MSIVLRGLPVLVEADQDARPAAFWWQNRRHINDTICVWDDSCDSSAHWLVQADGGRPVSLIYDRAASEWLMEWIQA